MPEYGDLFKVVSPPSAWAKKGIKKGDTVMYVSPDKPYRKAIQWYPYRAKTYEPHIFFHLKSGFTRSVSFGGRFGRSSTNIELLRKLK